MDDTQIGTPNGGTASSLFKKADSVLSGLGTRLRSVRAGFTEAPVTANEAPFSEAAPETVAQAEAKMRPATERAEESVEKAGERMGVFAATAGHHVRKAVALAREEAEDIWAEAQSLRRKDIP